VVDEEAYKPYFSLMDDNRGDPKAKQRLKAAMEAQGLQGDYLDHRYALMPGMGDMRGWEGRLGRGVGELDACRS
jgi:hypothetical protein